MTRNIDKLADSFTETRSVREEFEDQFLKTRPKSEWAPFIDEIAYDKAWDPKRMSIGNVGLINADFGRELGQLYRIGLEHLAGDTSGLPDPIDSGDISSTEIGTLAYKLAELGVTIDQADDAIDDLPRAVEILVEKILFELTDEPGHNPTISRVTSAASLVLELFDDPTTVENYDELITRLDGDDDLQQLLDRPVMKTRLWPHQREALETWLEEDCQGFVDMATATGKTVLGLAALAHRYGRLHPVDESLLPAAASRADVSELSESRSKAPQTESPSDKVLIVAHTNPVIEQWRREFDKHLNIPRERTDQGDEISLEWGTIHFQLAQNIDEQLVHTYDFVILDEAHHYASGQTWRRLLEGLEGDVLALSGSVDDSSEEATTVRRMLKRHVGKEVKHYPVPKARAHGIIPSFEWTVLYTGFEGQGTEIARLTEECEEAYTSVRKRFDTGDLSLGDGVDRPLRTYDDFRITANLTAEGRRLKTKDEEFRALGSKLNARRSKLVNETPRLETVLDIVTRHRDKKLIILTSKNAETDEVERRIRDTDTWGEDDVFVIRSGDERSAQIDEVDAYNDADAPAVIIGTGDLLGEGVDTTTAEVGINLATGTVTRDFIQRMGRILRNPQAIARSSGPSLSYDESDLSESAANEDKKHAKFYNIVGIPKSEHARVDREDGIPFLENAVEFLGFGNRIEQLPTFAAATPRAELAVADLEKAGSVRINSLVEDGDHPYDLPAGDVEQKYLDRLIRNVTASDWGSYLLAEWGLSDAEQPNVGEVGHVVDPLLKFDAKVSKEGQQGDGVGSESELERNKAVGGNDDSDSSVDSNDGERSDEVQPESAASPVTRDRDEESSERHGSGRKRTGEMKQTRLLDDRPASEETVDGNSDCDWKQSKFQQADTLEVAAGATEWHQLTIVVQSMTGKRVAGATVRLEDAAETYLVELSTDGDGTVHAYYPPEISTLRVQAHSETSACNPITTTYDTDESTDRLIVPLVTPEHPCSVKERNG